MVEGPETLRARSVIVSTPPSAAASILDDEIGRHLMGADAAPVVVVGLGGRGEQVLPAGFGALIGSAEGLTSLGMLFESSYAPERAPEGSWLIKVIAGGATRPVIAELDRVAEKVQFESEHVLGRRLDPSFVEVVPHRGGIPQYNVGHVRWLARLDDLLRERPGLHLTGWGYRGIGIGQLATDAQRVATQTAGDRP